jgi:hypothetical protein
VAIVLSASACSSPPPNESGAPGTSQAGVLDPNLAALTDRIRAGLNQQGEFVTELSTASAASPLPSGARSLAIVAQTMLTWVGDEQQWLAEHPAEACYAAVQDLYAQAVQAIAASATVFGEIGSPSPSPAADPQAAIESLIAARTTIQDANAQATAAVPACTRTP